MNATSIATGHSTWRRALIAVALVGMLVLAGMDVVLTVWTHGERHEAAARDDAVDAARVAVVALTSRNLDETARLDAATSRRLTDRFRDDYLKSRAASMADGDAKVMVSVNARDAAAETISDDRAVVLVSADALRAGPKGKDRGVAHYRLRVTMVHLHGHWLVDDLVAL